MIRIQIALVVGMLGLASVGCGSANRPANDPNGESTGGAPENMGPSGTPGAGPGTTGSPGTGPGSMAPGTPGAPGTPATPGMTNAPGSGTPGPSAPGGGTQGGGNTP